MRVRVTVHGEDAVSFEMDLSDADVQLLRSVADRVRFEGEGLVNAGTSRWSIPSMTVEEVDP